MDDRIYRSFSEPFVFMKTVDKAVLLTGKYVGLRNDEGRYELYKTDEHDEPVGEMIVEMEIS